MSPRARAAQSWAALSWAALSRAALSCAVLAWAVVGPTAGCRQPVSTEPPAEPGIEEQIAAYGVELSEAGVQRGSFPPDYPTSAPINDAPFDVVLPEPALHRLESGLSLAITPYRRLPLSAVSIAVGHGHAQQSGPGVADLLAGLLYSGAGSWSAEDIALRLDSLGATLSIEVGPDRTTLELGVLDEQLGPALELLGTLLSYPLFEAEELSRERARQLGNLEQQEVQPAYLAKLTLDRLLYGEAHPYGRPGVTALGLESVQRPDLVAAHTAWFTAPNTHISIASGVAEDQVLALVEGAFADLPTNAPPVQQLAAPAGIEGPPGGLAIVVVDRPGSVQTELLWGSLLPAEPYPEEVLDRLAVSVLGGSASSRLFMELRERQGLTYGAYARLDPRPLVGALRSGTAVRTDVTIRAVEALLAELDGMREPIEAAELNNARTILLGRYARATTVVTRLASLQLGRLLRPDASRPWSERLAALEAPGSAEIAERTARLFQPARPVLVLVGDAARFRDELGRFGQVME